MAAAVLATVLIFAWSGAHALWARLSEKDLVTASGVIVVGTLTEFVVVKNVSDDKNRTVGIINVDRMLKGDPDIKNLRLNVPQPGTPISSSDIFFKIGQTGLWFLRLLEPGNAAIYAADHPQRFVPADQAASVVEATRKYLKP